MKRVVPLFACVLVGIGIGWYFESTRPTAKNQGELLKQYQYVRDSFHMTDEQMAEAGANIQQYMADMNRADEMAAKVSFAAFINLERGNVEDAKSRLLTSFASYYRLYHAKGGDTNFIALIEQAAATNAVIAAKISRRIE